MSAAPRYHIALNILYGTGLPVLFWRSTILKLRVRVRVSRIRFRV